MRSVILHRNNTVRGMQHTVHRFESGGRYQTPRQRFALDIQPERNATINVRRMTNLICS